MYAAVKTVCYHSCDRDTPLLSVQQEQSRKDMNDLR
jgi:hypothetical protein